MFFPLILLRLSNVVALHHLAIGGLVFAAPQTAIIRAEEWPRGTARGGSTVNLHKLTIVGGRDWGLLSYLELVAFRKCFVARRSQLPHGFAWLDLVIEGGI
jgi:hypothetical protein